MKTMLIKIIASVAALLGLLMLVGDIPEASVATFVTAKIAGAAILWGAARVMEKYIPEETV